MITVGTQAVLHAQPGFAMHCVVSREDWSRVRSVRYESLLAEGDIDATPEGAYPDPHDRRTDSSTFLLTRSGRAAGTVRANISSPARCGVLPASDVFGREIGSYVGLDRTIVEGGLIGIDPASTLDRRITLVHLLKGPLLLCELVKADWMLMAVREDEIGFYRRMFNMEILSGAETLWGMAAPRVLMGLQYREHAALLFRRMPLLAVSADDVNLYATTGYVRFTQPERRNAA